VARKKKIGPLGETLEEFLESVGLREEVYDGVIKRVLAWQLEQARKKRAMTKEKLAARMKTSRSQLDRVLDPDNYAVSIQMLNRAAMALGKHLRIELVDRA
jgi:antitoxin HicB